MILTASNQPLPFPTRATPEKSYEYIALNMKITDALVDTAISEEWTFYTSAAKVACYALIPFLAIAAFEALIVNSLRIIANVVIALVNGLSACFGAEPHAASKIYQCTEIQKNAIREIISIVSNNSKLSLLFKNRDRLNTLEDTIKLVHPLKFLSIIISDRQAKKELSLILEDPFKRLGFIKGLSDSLINELQQETLHCHLEQFARSVGVSTEKLLPLIASQKWEEFVRMLI